jgi:hypothetical protein
MIDIRRPRRSAGFLNECLAIDPRQFAPCYEHGGAHNIGGRSMREDVASAIRFAGFFFGFVALIIVVALAAWRYMANHPPVFDRHAARSAVVLAKVEPDEDHPPAGRTGGRRGLFHALVRARKP